MRILILTYQGGMAGSTYSISYLAAGLADKGHEVYVGCPEDSLLFDLMKNTGVHLLPMTFRSKTDRQCIRHIHEIVEEHGIEIINTQSSKDRYLAMFAKLSYHLPAQIIHTRRQMCKSVGGPMAFLTRVTSTGIVAVSKEVKESLKKAGFPKKMIRVIPNGTPVSKFESIDTQLVASLKQRYAILPEDVVIGVVSRLKDQIQLVKALPYIPFRVKLIFVGIRREELGMAGDSLWAEHDIHFTGRVTPQEALAHYKLFSLKVLPSRMEGLSQSLLEAMYLKVPVVATAAGGNLSLIENGVNGILFPHDQPVLLADAIERIVHSPALRERLTNNARRLVETNYSMHHTVQTYENYFRSIVTSEKRMADSGFSLRQTVL